MESLGVQQNFIYLFLFLPVLLQHTELLAREAAMGSLRRRIMDTFGGCVTLITSISQHLPFQTVCIQEQRAAKYLFRRIKTQKQL